jgi:hypothetical protein
MKHSLKLTALSITVSLGTAGTSSAQQPPDVVQSDANGNTAMGGYALENTHEGQNASNLNTAAGASSLFSNTLGSENSAFGYGAMYYNTIGNFNSAVGDAALEANTTAWNGTAMGAEALTQNTTADNNTAIGAWVLVGNITGGSNTATGAFASTCNVSGSNNTAVGAYSLSGAVVPVPHGFSPACASINATATGSGNTASGYAALNANTTGDGNTASGAQALTNNTAGNKNTASGYLALTSNISGSYNTATGNEALYSNRDGIRNTASGDWGLFSNTHGNDNTADGHDALHSNTVGSNNIGLGANSGYNVTSGSNNIEIGNEGMSSDGGTIRIGTSGSQTATYIAGIENAQVTGAAVFVTSSGQLGVLASSERYKTAIVPMSVDTEKLQELRPVSFHLKTDPKGALQYGLIAEEVAKVYPELVIRDKAGRIQGVRYDELAPMLLNEIQQQQAQLQDMKQQLAQLKQINESMQAAILKLQDKDQRIAMR